MTGAAETDEQLCSVCFECHAVGWRGSCGMCFCSECCARYIETAVAEAKLTNDGHLRCPCHTASGCNTLPDERIQALVDPECFAKYLKFSLAKRVTSDPDLFWCPAAGCSTVVKRTDSGSRITCQDCDTTFCSKCGNLHGYLVPCTVSGDMAFMAWRASGGARGEGIKRCPQCRYFIEKNEGCMHMTCSHCRYEFCWACRGRWRGGCKNKFCFLERLMDEPFWGSSVPVRTFTKVVGVPLGVCVGLAAAGVALGAAVAAAGVGVAAVVVVCPVALVYKGVKSCVSYSSHVHRETVYTRNELVMRGVQVLLSVNVGDERFQQIVQMFTEGRWLSQYVYLAYTQAWDGTALLYLVAQEAHDQFPDTQTHARVLLAAEEVSEQLRNSPTAMELANSLCTAALRLQGM